MVKKIAYILILAISFLSLGCNYADRDHSLTETCPECHSSVQYLEGDRVERPTRCDDEGKDICIWAVIR